MAKRINVVKQVAPKTNTIIAEIADTVFGISSMRI